MLDNHLYEGLEQSWAMSYPEKLRSSKFRNSRAMDFMILLKILEEKINLFTVKPPMKLKAVPHHCQNTKKT